MEELQSTDILDREILEDARKKASRILKTADDTIRVQTEDWEKKTAELIDELDKKYKAQYEAAAAKIAARALIDKRRSLIGRVEDLLQSASHAWFETLDRKRVTDLLADELKEKLSYLEEFSDLKEIKASCYNLEKKEAEEIIKKAGIKREVYFSAEPSPAFGKFPSVVLESENIRVTASIQKTMEYLLHKRRTELTEALIGRIRAEERI